MEKKYLIGIDSGTTRIKAVLFDLDGSELFSKGENLTPYTLYENWYEQDMLEIWEKGTSCIKEVASHVGKHEIAGIGITAQGDGLWMIDEKGEPVRKGMCFCDGRTSEIIDAWKRDGTLEKTFDISGTAAFGSSICAEIRWLDIHEPGAMVKAKWCLHLKDWVFYKLTGKVYSDDTDMCIPMLNVKTRQYDDELFRLFGISQYRGLFPPLRRDNDYKEPVLPELAEKLGLAPDTVISAGPVDLAACALSCGAIENGQAVSIIGTAAIHSVILDSPRVEPRLLGMMFMHYRQDRWIRLMSSLCGSPNLEWFLENLGGGVKQDAEAKGIPLYDYCSELVNGAPIGANGVVYYPYLLAGGERAPFFKSTIKASFSGISFNTTMSDMLRSVFEGVAMAMVDCYNVVPTELSEVIVSGGGAGSDVWMQIFADAIGKDIVTFEGKEHGARGAAINNGVAAGIFSDYESAIGRMAKVRKRYRPIPENHTRYRGLYELYRAGYRMNMDWWDLRNDFLRGQNG
jgi:sugar (pentulose or hexulose) kinase